MYPNIFQAVGIFYNSEGCIGLNLEPGRKQRYNI